MEQGRGDDDDEDCSSYFVVVIIRGGDEDDSNSPFLSPFEPSVSSHVTEIACIFSSGAKYLSENKCPNLLLSASQHKP
jgi:hypothetical protein